MNDVHLAFVTLEREEACNTLTHLHRTIETMKYPDQINFSCASSCEKLISCAFHN